MIRASLSTALVILLLVGCERDAQDAPGTSASDATTQDSAAQPDTAIADTTVPDDTPMADAGVDAGPVDPYPDAWIVAPQGWCDSNAHLAVVSRVIDGDTLELNGGDRVRLIGVDAPEVFSDECWSGEATDALDDLSTPGTVVCMVEDSNSSPVDPYDRLLRYVFAEHNGDWVMLNARVVRLGAARAYHAFLKGKDYRTEIEVAEEEAFADHAGGWSACSW